MALGATRWQTVKHAVIRSAFPGIIAAIILGFGRAFGETMAVLMVVGNVPEVPVSIFLLCDEPTSSLDPISAAHIERQLFALRQDYTIVFVTHTLRQARRLADHVVFPYLGELIEHGPTETIFTQPNDPRTKAYMKGAFG